MLSFLRTLMLPTILVLVVAGLAAGCGGDDDSGDGDSGSTSTSTSSDDGGGGDDGGGDIDAKSLFTSSCGGCHTLDDAGTSGAVGPNLDDAAPDESRVRAQIENGGGGMPANLLEGEEADAVAAYVADAAGG